MKSGKVPKSTRAITLRPANENGQQGARHDPSDGTFGRRGVETTGRPQIPRIRWPVDSQTGGQEANARLGLRPSILPPLFAAVNYRLHMVRRQPGQLFPNRAITRKKPGKQPVDVDTPPSGEL
jgi:hypothetical protein